MDQNSFVKYVIYLKDIRRSIMSRQVTFDYSKAAVVVTAAIPFAWIIAVQHHSALHARFTFRILSVAAAAAITFIVLIVRNVKKCQKN